MMETNVKIKLDSYSIISWTQCSRSPPFEMEEALLFIQKIKITYIHKYLLDPQMSHLVTTMCSHLSSDISTNPLTNLSFMINLHPRYLSKSPNLHQIFKGLKRKFEFEA
jgi:hypothetical protein